MYNLSGIYFQTKALVLIMGGLGLISLGISRFWIPKKRKVKELWFGLLECFFCICVLGAHLYIINDLKIFVHEGEFIREHRAGKSIIRSGYVFSNEEELKPTFYLDIFSKKEIYPAEFEKGVRYRIYYEDRTSVIVKVEKLE